MSRLSDRLNTAYPIDFVALPVDSNPEHYQVDPSLTFKKNANDQQDMGITTFHATHINYGIKRIG